MSVSTKQQLVQVLAERRTWLRESGDRLQSLARADDLETLFREIGQARSLIAAAIRRDSDRFGHDELFELQSRMHAELDEFAQLAIKVLIEQRTQSLAELAHRDSLTTLLNRAAFDRRLRDEVERARRYQRELSLVLFDIDHFKSVNDRFGHPTGDRVLLKVASILESSLRQSDAAFRYGGDEFAAVCPETSGDSMSRVLGRIETSVRYCCLEAQPAYHIGISWGVASFPVDAQDPSELIYVADERLYDCKKEHHRKLAGKC
jgi:diguanylate cyclase (GGDEF)-like protein